MNFSFLSGIFASLHLDTNQSTSEFSPQIVKSEELIKHV